MKKMFFLFTGLFSVTTLFSQSVGIGTSTPNANSVLDVSSGTKAMILPRLNALAMDRLPPAEGMLVFNTETKTLMCYSGGGSSTAASQAGGANIASIFSGTNIGQSFTAIRDMIVGTITFPIQQVNFGSATFQVKLHSGNGYSGPVLGTVNTIISSAGTATFDFESQNIRLLMNTVYTLELSHVGSGGAVNFWINPSGGYSGGTQYYNGIADPAADMQFAVNQVVTAGWKSVTL